MKLSISNIAWDASNDLYMLDYLKKTGFSGIEIAPTRVIAENPYDNEQKAKDFKVLVDDHGLVVASIQSIWFQRNERIFYGEQERQTAIEYTKKAIDFANVIDCNNLVFGCPKNRSYGNKSDIEKGIVFFEAVSSYAHERGRVFALEPNPTIYNTNFINTTAEAFAFVNQLGSNGFKVNLDFGTIIQNEEDLQVISDHLELVNHVHISEPYLAEICRREKHQALCEILKQGGYDGFVSIEMKNPGDLDIVKETMDYVKEVFA